jgi:serine/threonine protein kinase/tetratricopeptide (TPR) repeat protein
LGCPEEDDLLAFVDGQLVGESGSAIAQHLPGCAACAEVVAALAREHGAANPSPPPTADDANLARGDRVSRYVVLGPLGRGGMSVVYLAYDPDLDRKVALKMLKRSLSELLGPDARARVLREGQAMARLSHPNVLPVHDVGVHEGRVFLATEFVDGWTLGAWLALGQRPEDILRTFLAAGAGLSAAHAQRLVHRDFKPDNVLIGRDGRARVADFGLVSGAPPPDPASPDAQGGKPSRSLLAGTPAYMSPEQRRGEPTDARGDQYSFCVALVEALTRRRPKGDLSEFPLPRALVPVLRRGLSEQPEQRFESMDLLLAALRRATQRPRQLRRAVAAGVALVLLLGGAALLRGKDAALPMREGCAAPAERLAGIWDEPQAATIHRAFLATGKGNAEETATRLRSVLSRFSDDFRTSWQTACAWERDARAPEPRSRAAFATLCLDAQREELSVLVEGFKSVDAVLLDRSLEAARGLPRPASCVDEGTWRRRSGLSTTAGDDTSRRALHLRLARVHALTRAYQFKEATGEAQALVAEARRSGDAALLTDALLAEGIAHSMARDAAAAEPSLREAFTLGLGAGQDALAARAATELVRVVGSSGERVPEGRIWLTVAHAALKRHGSAPELQAKLANIEGNFLYLSGEHARSTELLEEALKLRREHVGEESVEYAAILFNLGRNLEFAGRTREAHARLRQSLEITERVLGSMHPQVGVNSSGVAYTAMQLGDLQTADRFARRALEVTLGGPGERAFATAEARMQLCEVALARGELAEATALAAQVSSGDTSKMRPTSVVRAEQCACLAHAQLGDLGMAEKSCHRAVSLLESKKGLDPADLATALETRGSMWADAGRMKDAERDFLRARGLLEKAEAGTLASRAGLARCALHRGDPHAARAQLGDPRAGLTGSDVLWRAEALLQSGRIARALGEAPEAERLFDEASALLGPDERAFAPLRHRIAEARATASPDVKPR